MSECTCQLGCGEERKHSGDGSEHDERLDRSEHSQLALARILGGCGIAHESGEREDQYARSDAVLDRSAGSDVEGHRLGEDRICRCQQGAEYEHRKHGECESPQQGEETASESGARLGGFEQDDRGVEHASDPGEVGEQRVHGEAGRVRACEHGERAERSDRREAVECDQPCADPDHEAER